MIYYDHCCNNCRKGKNNLKWDKERDCQYITDIIYEFIDALKRILITFQSNSEQCFI